MLDIEATEKIMHGFRMELEDCAYPTLSKVNVFTNAEEAMKDIDCGFFFGNKMILTKDIKRVDLLAANKDMFIELGEIFDKYAKPNALVYFKSFK